MTTDKNISEELTAHYHQVEQNQLAAEVGVESGRVRDGLALQAGDLANRDFANQLHGKLSLIRGINQFFRAAEIRMAKEVKERELWRHIVITDEGGSFRAAKNFTEYCKYALGMGDTKVYEGIQNVEVFGEKFDVLQEMGIKRDEFRLLRKAPEGIIEEAKAAAERHDKDALLDLIDDLSARHAKEKEKLDQEKQELTDKVKNLESECQVGQRMLEDRDKKVNELERELRRDLTPDQEAKKRTERDKELLRQLAEKSLSSIAAINELALVVEKAMDLENAPEYMEKSIYGELEKVFRHALKLGRQYGITPEQMLGLPVADIAAFDHVIEEGLE